MIITLNTLPAISGTKSRKRRIGRGYGSGRAKTSGRGMKGQGARSNRGRKPGFEGGQMRMLMRFPKKKGFRSVIAKKYQVVNVEKLNIFAAGTEVTPELLFDRGLISSPQRPIKILGTGELKVKLSLNQEKFVFSKSAQAKIEQAGGTVKV